MDWPHAGPPADGDRGEQTMQVPRAPIAEGVCRTRLAGDLDLASAARVTEHLARLVHRGSRVLVDLSDVHFMDCAGLTPLVGAHHRAVAGGGWVRLCGVRPGQVRVLLLTDTAWLLGAQLGG